MSFNKLEIKSFTSKENSPLKKQLNEVWKQFMSSFGYQKYYDLKWKNTESNIYKSTSEIEQNNRTFNTSIKNLFQLFEENSISVYEDNNFSYLISNNKKGSFLLSDPKIWIMYIIFIELKSNIYPNKIQIIMELFKEAIKNNCDIISLFEFFLIFISKLDKEDFSFFKMNNINKLIPKEFICLYNNKKSILKSIFIKDDYNYFGVSSDFVNTQSTIFSTSKQKTDDYINHNKEYNKEFKLNENEGKTNVINNIKKFLDFNNLFVICKDYLNKGFFAIFKEKNNKIENEKDELKQFINNEFEEEDEEEYYLMPLLEKYVNYDQKMDANQALILINKSVYKNYTYYPYDINIINKL